MRTGKRLRPVLRSTVAALALVAAGAGPLTAPAPARAADTVRGLQWYLDTLKIPQAHKTTKGRGVTVAVLDTGVDPNVPDLRGRVLRGHGIGSDASSDGRGTDDRTIGHGTGMAGLIVGQGGGVMRQLGIAPEAKVLPVSVGAKPDHSEVAEGIRWATDAGADVINMSLGGRGPGSDEEQAAVRYALSKNVVLVAAAGNREQGSLGVDSPANIPGVIAVTGLAKDGGFFSGSTDGPEAVLAAPMEDIITPRPKSVSPNGYGVGSGTSESTAIVSGVAALVRAKYPDLDAANVVNRLIRTAQDRGPAGRDEQFGFGAVDPVAALTRPVPAVEANPLLAGSAGAPDEPTRESTRSREDDGPAVSFAVKNKTGAVIQAVLCLAVPVGVAILVIVLVRRSRRRPAGPPVGGPGFPPPGHGFPPGGVPGQHGPYPLAPTGPAGYGPSGHGVPGQGAGPYGPPPGGPMPQAVAWPPPGATPPAPPPPAPPGPGGHHQ